MSAHLQPMPLGRPLKKFEGEKWCGWCGAMLYRKRRANGRAETCQAFSNRKFCDKKCFQECVAEALNANAS